MSYAHGTSTTPLLGETIGGCLDRVTARFGDREALVDMPTGRRWTYAQLDRRRRHAGARAARPRGSTRATGSGIWAPNCAEWTLVQYATAKVGAILVNINPAYRIARARLRARPVGLPAAGQRARSSRARRLRRRWSTRCAASLPALEGTIYLGSPRVGHAGRARRLDADAPAARPRGGAAASTTRSTSSTRPGTTGFPKGATLSHHNILNNGFFVGELCGYTEADRVCIPVPFYHCFGMVMGNLGGDHARRVHGDPGAVVRPRRDAAGRPGRALHVAVRRADDVHRRARACPTSPSYDLSSLRTGIMAGSPCPVEVMKRVVADMGMHRGDDLLRHDRDLAGVDPDAGRRRPRAAGVDGRHACTRTSR